MKGIKYLAAASMVAAAVVFMSASDSSISQSGDTTVVNTTLIGKNIRGFKGQTPREDIHQGQQGDESGGS